MDSPHDPYLFDKRPATPSEAQLLTDMKQSELDVAAGRVVPLADVLVELDEVVRRIEARRVSHIA
jgi:hypothetical protein